jgi:hypothetical protein
LAAFGTITLYAVGAIAAISKASFELTDDHFLRKSVGYWHTKRKDIPQFWKPPTSKCNKLFSSTLVVDILNIFLMFSNVGGFRDANKPTRCLARMRHAS